MPHTFRDLPDFHFWRVLQALSERDRPEIRRQFARAVDRLLRELGQPGRAALIRRAIERGDVEAAVQAVPWEVLERALEEIVETELARTLERAAEATSKELLARMEGRSLAEAARRATLPSAGLALAFDRHNRRAAQWLERHGAELVTEITEESRRALRQILVQNLRAGRGPAGAVNATMDVIGLTRRQAQAVRNFREAVEAALAGDLTRAQIERRFTLARRMGLSRITEERVDTLVHRYRDRLHRHRAAMIARTETLEAASEGQRALWTEATEKGVIQEEEWEREWVAIVPDPDRRTCELCEDLDGARAPIGGGRYFARLTPEGIEGPRRHAACRCTERIVRKRAARAA